MRPMRLLCLCVSLLFGLSPVLAQVYTGSITGVVTDATGGVVPGATVKVTDVDRGFSSTAETDDEGRYVLRSLAPGNYRLSAELPGFRTLLRDGIVLSVNQNVTVDLTLQVGEQRETVEVVASGPVLAMQDAVTGQVINRVFINDLPLVGRSVFDLAFLAPGITPPTGCNGCYLNNFHSNGGRNATNDILLDGVSTTGFDSNAGLLAPLYSPSVDTVLEFKVEQSNMSAEVGLTGSTAINVVTRSGTNQYHGSAYNFHRNNILTANNWFSNAAGVELAPRRYNLFGATVGGPIRKDRTFFFVSFEGLRDNSGQTIQMGVPSAAMRKGDFTELCPGGFDATGKCKDPGGQLWDPYSGVYDSNEGGPVRSLFVPFNNLATYQSPGNPKLNGTPFQLPARPGNLIDPVASKMIQAFPLPNRGVGSPDYDRFNNWIAARSSTVKRGQWDIKADHNFSEYDRLSARLSLGETQFREPDCFGNPLDPCSFGTDTARSRLLALNHNHTFSPTTLLGLTYGVTRAFSTRPGAAKEAGYDPIKELGLPSYMARSGIPAVPYIYLDGYRGGIHGGSIGSRSWNGGTVRAQDTHHLLATLSRIQGRHDLKFGGEGKMRRTNEVLPGAPGGVYAYSYGNTAEKGWSGGGGDAMASFLTGVGTAGGWGLYQIPTWLSTQNFQFSGFVQDNWKVTDKLTVNLGVRYDLETPRTERFNRMSYLDPDVPSPLKVPGLPNLRGGLQFVDSDRRSNHITDRNNWAPRIGFAYRLTDEVVLRGGYGIFYQASGSGASGIGAGDTQGFAQDTDWITEFQADGATPFGPLSNPHPGGPKEPPGRSLGALTDIGGRVFGPLRTGYFNTTPYEQTWTFGIQHELPGAILLDATYVGKKGTHLPFGGAGGLNTLGPEIATFSRDQINTLFERVPNPFFGILTSGNLSGPDVQRFQLLRPFPHFEGFEASQLPIANSIYHALQVRGERRFSNGLQFLVTYTKSKSIDDSSVSSGGASWLGGGVSLQNPWRRDLERSVSQFDIPQVLQVSYVYELPIGRGKSLGTNWHPALSAILGGWKTSGIWRFSSGQPLGLSLSGGRSLPTFGPQRPNLTGTLQRNTGSDFRQKFFSNPEVAVKPQPFVIGNAPRVLSNLRAPGSNLANLALFKEIPLGRVRDGMKLEYRAEAFNAFNHPIFCGPNTQVGNPSFGKVFSQCQSPREIQMALKLYW